MQIDEKIYLDKVEVELGQNLQNDMQKMEPSLDSVVDALSSLFESLKDLEDKDIVICVGNPGSGKSTMLTSLTSSPSSLKPCVIIQNNIKRKAITLQNQGSQLKTPFTLSHTPSQVQSFRPAYHHDP